MNKKILCPWCGAEMEAKAAHHGIPRRWNAWTSCTSEACGAVGPIVIEMEVESKEEAEEAARAAVMRRYTPPQKPMSFEEALTTDDELWMEERNDGAVWACRWFVNGLDKRITAQYIASYPKEFDYADYGRTWRCWFQRPTKEQMEAATWES